MLLILGGQFLKAAKDQLFEPVGLGSKRVAPAGRHVEIGSDFCRQLLQVCPSIDHTRPRFGHGHSVYFMQKTILSLLVTGDFPY